MIAPYAVQRPLEFVLAAMTKSEHAQEKLDLLGSSRGANNDNGGQWVTNVALEVHRSFAAL